MSLNVVSLFAGCGGLDLGFRQAGFHVVWANEFDNTITATYCKNHPATILNTSDIRTLDVDEIPECDGIIGGPPCQSWSEGGKGLGIEDERGKLFFDYIRIVKIKKPKFFVIENVAGILNNQHKEAFSTFLQLLTQAGYHLEYSLLNTADFQIPQDRFRIFIIGFRNDLNLKFCFPLPSEKPLVTLFRAIGDLPINPPFTNSTPSCNVKMKNHEYYSGTYDQKFMSRNRVRGWNEVSFTIQALAKNVPLHPQAPKMQFISNNQRQFVKGKEYLYRRLTIRECARIQTFPDSFEFIYTDIRNGYKMVGNAVPPRMAKILAQGILKQLENTCKHRTAIKEKVMIVPIYKNRKRTYYQDFINRTNKTEYYFGKDMQFDTRQLKYFVPIINGYIQDIYTISEVVHKQRSEYPSASNTICQPNDIRLVFKLTTPCYVDDTMRRIKLKPNTFQLRKFSYKVFDSIEELLKHTI